MQYIEKGTKIEKASLAFQAWQTFSSHKMAENPEVPKIKSGISCMQIISSTTELFYNKISLNIISCSSFEVNIGSDYSTVNLQNSFIAPIVLTGSD